MMSFALVIRVIFSAKQNDFSSVHVADQEEHLPSAEVKETPRRVVVTRDVGVKKVGG